jgi:hypothetical protein
MITFLVSTLFLKEIIKISHKTDQVLTHTFQKTIHDFNFDLTSKGYYN